MKKLLMILLLVLLTGPAQALTLNITCGPDEGVIYLFNAQTTGSYTYTFQGRTFRLWYGATNQHRCAAGASETIVGTWTTTAQVIDTLAPNWQAAIVKNTDATSAASAQWMDGISLTAGLFAAMAFVVAASREWV